MLILMILLFYVDIDMSVSINNISVDRSVEFGLYCGHFHSEVDNARHPNHNILAQL